MKVHSIWARLFGGSSQAIKSRHTARPRVEYLEDRTAPATFTVTSDANAGVGTLRQAILNANAAAGADVINFNIGGAGLHTINLTGALPAIVGKVTIDGGTQPGFVTTPLIELNGAGAGAGASGLIIGATASGTVIRDLAINRFAAHGIVISSSSNILEGNFIGTNAAGTAASANAFNGIVITGANNNIGGTFRNVISGNGRSGILISGVAAIGTKITGNLIGLNVGGTAAIGNQLDGILIAGGAKNSTIGGTSLAVRNMISGNVLNGVHLTGAGTSGNHVLGNFIGLNGSGTVVLGNGANGVLIDGAAKANSIGAAAIGGNTISGNNAAGVAISGVGSNANIVFSNSIGIDINGNNARPNRYGVVISAGADLNVIGGAIAGSGNIISANLAHGVLIRDVGTNGNVVQKNRVGTVGIGNAALPNGLDGVAIIQGASGNTIGGATAFLGNHISGNAAGGVLLNGVSANFVKNNTIGLNAAGSAAIANELAGIRIRAAAKNNTIAGNTVSGNDGAGILVEGVGTAGNLLQLNAIGFNVAHDATVPNQDGVLIHDGASSNILDRNNIAGNGFNGVRIRGIGTSNNVLKGNLIGTSFDGTADLGNSGIGVLIDNGATGNKIGGPAVSDRNIVSGNSGTGVRITDAGTANNLVQGNFVGLSLNGAAAIGNSQRGVSIESQATSNLVVGNVVSGNGLGGVMLQGAGTSNNVIKGNKIGINAAGAAALGNSGDGVVLFQEANNNVIGGTSAADRNIISGNTAGGILISNSESALILGNFVGTDVSGSIDLGNGGAGIQLVFSRNNTIGGTSPGARNVISGNGRGGIEFFGNAVAAISSFNNRVIGNFIGTAADGVTALGNTEHGVYLHTFSTNNFIGGTTPGSGNVIAFNSGDGVLIGHDPSPPFNHTVDAGPGNAILGNRIFGNNGQAIDLGANDAVTPNDSEGHASGPNNFMNFPVIDAAFVLDALTFIGGRFTQPGLTNRLVRIEFYTTSDTQARVFLGATVVLTDNSGEARFSEVFAVASTPGHRVTAIATDLTTFNTSELAALVTIA